NIPPEQPGTSKSKDLNNTNTAVHLNQGPPGEPSRAAMNNSASNKRDSTDELQRKLDVFREKNNTIQLLSVTQQRSSSNSAQSAGNQGQQCNVQVTRERIQERKEVSPLPSPEPDPQPEGHTMDHEGSEMGKGRPIVRATTIDEFLKENGIGVALEGLTTGEQVTEQHDDGEDSMELNQNYYQYVMANSDDDEGNI
ncbi:hypothetical protein PIB30_101385, partial [Stylosanthes scabra]|nr:hypothetical protein [Stylosanthes scabra]